MSKYVHDLTDEQLADVMVKLTNHLSEQNVINQCTPRGNGKSIKTNKPKDGIMVYIWRMARFHNGTDMTMPMMCYFDLGDGIEHLTGISLCISITTPNVKQVLEFCDVVVDKLVRQTGGDENAAAKRWGKAFYG